MTIQSKVPNPKSAVAYRPPVEDSHVLGESICNRNGQILDLQIPLSVLHNEIADSRGYPLQLNDHLFFSEALCPGSINAPFYFRWVTDSLQAIDEALTSAGHLPFEDIDGLGKRVQLIDAEMIRELLQNPIDPLHLCFGQSPEHPYRKITLCRVGIAVQVGPTITQFMFEKFLVVYSYRDLLGQRRSTRTPIHSHPLNHEVTYFLSGNSSSQVIEEEFAIKDAHSNPLILDNGSFNPVIREQIDREHLDNVKIEHIATYERGFATEPIILEEFPYDLRLGVSDFVSWSDGFFRPHRVTVLDGSADGDETLYYAINNYWTPTGRVYVYDHNCVSTWNYTKWHR